MPPVTTQIAGGADVEDLARALSGELAMRFTRTYGVSFTCGCSRARVERTLFALGRDELRAIVEEQPQTEVICEFCKEAYHFTREDLEDLIERLEARSSSGPG
jgi:molecular chaperone Hsp33